MDSLPTRGWAEALNGMKVGSKWEVYLPPSLAYGNEGRPNIEPGATLIFEIELVDTEAPQPPKPVTSDIIRVPSAEEMKAGAQIEVIKPEDLEKHAVGGQTNQVKTAN
jgi:FKBP-type peptidyl-prolyl cis-trans isomerase 2